MTFGLKTTKNKFVLEDGTIVSFAEEHVVLGITTNFSLTLYPYSKQLCKKAANKLKALTRIATYLSYSQRWHIYSSFFTEQLSYYPLIWTFCSRQSNYLINQLQEQDLRVTYDNHDSIFSELLEMSNESTIPIENKEVLMTGIYKSLNNILPSIISDIFQKQENYYSLRNPRSLVSKRKFATTCGIDTIIFQRSSNLAISSSVN